MPEFDFITAKEFRSSLESDQREMSNCFEKEAWKACLVMGGSIVEALVVDHLIATPNPQRSKKDPLSFELAEAVRVCREEGILSARTADLCSVIRSYRNLIHAGRVIRHQEPVPDRESASIVMSLVEMIAGEIGRARRERVGPTAEEIKSKLLRDSDSLTIFKHLIREASETQRERLLREHLPEAFKAEKANQSDPFDDVLDRISSAFRTTLDMTSDEIKTNVGADFVRVLKQEDGEYAAAYFEHFFRSSDLELVGVQYKPMVIDYILGRSNTIQNHNQIRMLKSICPYLAPSDAPKYVDLMVRSATVVGDREYIRQAAKEQLTDSSIGTTSEFDRAADKRLKEWIHTFEQRGSLDKARLIREIIENMIPF